MSTIPRPRRATPEDLEPVRSALAEFRTHWTETIPTLHQQVPCPFDGQPEDIDALDYLDYEGLSYPPCGLFGAALVWGNVLAESGAFRWFVDGLGELLLYSEGLASLAIWPFGRVWESQHCGWPQFGKYAWLLKITIGQSLLGGGWSNEAEGAMAELIRWVGSDDTDYLAATRSGLGSYQRLHDLSLVGSDQGAKE